MIWKFSGNLPVYQQIMEQIRGAVLSGEYSPGQKIASVRDLAMEAQVNPNTMQHALQELEREGLLVTEGTSGRHVTADPAMLAKLRTNCLRELTAAVAEKYAVLGISLKEAAKLLMALEEEEVK